MEFRSGRSKVLSRGMRWLTTAGLIAVAIASTGLAQAAPFTLYPPYVATTIVKSPVTWNTGAGYIIFYFPTSATPGNGYVVIDPHALSGPGLGTHGSDGTEAGFNVSYACGPSFITGCGYSECF